MSALGTRGAPQLVTGLATPLTITIPLRDLSIVQWSAAAGKAMGVNVGNASFIPRSFNVTCPTSAAAGALGVRAVYTAPPALAGQAASVSLASTSTTNYLTPLAPSGGVQNVGLGAAAVSGVDGAEAPPIAAGVASAAGTTLLLKVDCGAPWGSTSFLCGPGMGGNVASFSCPSLQSVPQCLWWDSSAASGSGGWSTSGCSVTGLTETAVTCDCDRFGDFAARFATLDLPDNDLFAADVPQPLLPSTAKLLLGLGCGIAAVTALCALLAEAREGEQQRRFAKHLDGDPEVWWLSHAVGSVPLLELAQGPRASARVAPQDSPGASPPAAVALVQQLGLGSAAKSSESPAIRELSLLLCGSLDPLRMTVKLKGEGEGEGAEAPPMQPLALPPAPRIARGNTLAYFWALLWLRGGSLGHPFLSWLRLFDPRRPASLRAVSLGATLVLSLLSAVVAMVTLYGSARTFVLQPLTPTRFIVVAAIVGAALPLLHASLRAIIDTPAGAAAWASRYPVLAAELVRRHAAAALLEGEGSETMLAALRGCGVAPETLPGDDALRYAMLRGAPLPLFARSAAALLRSAHAATSRRAATPLPSASFAPEEPQLGLKTHLSYFREGGAPSPPLTSEAPSQQRLALPPKVPPPTLNDVFEAWEEARDAPPQPPRCCSSRWRAQKDATRAEFDEFCASIKAADGDIDAPAESGDAWTAGGAATQQDDAGGAAPQQQLQLVEAWSAVAGAASRGGGGGSSCGGSLVAWAGHLALWVVVGITLQVLAAFDEAREASAVRALALAWLAGLALGAFVFMPLATALSLAWQLYAWPLVVAPAAAPWAEHARAQEKALRSTALPAREALAGRLELLLHGLAAARGAQLPAADAICAGLPLSVLALALHGRAHSGAYAAGAAASSGGAQSAPMSARAAFFRNALLVARVAAAAGVPLREGRPPLLAQHAPPPPAPLTPPPPTALDSPPPPHHDWQRRGLNMQWAETLQGEEGGQGSNETNPGVLTSAGSKVVGWFGGAAPVGGVSMERFQRRGSRSGFATSR